MVFNKKLAIERVVKIVEETYLQSENLVDIKVDKKKFNDIVTNVDIFIEKNIISKLKKFYPKHSFNAEESGKKCNEKAGDEYEWVIDPIDGTVQFVAGLYDFGVVVALKKNGETILGATFLPKLGDMYTSIKSEGAYCNGQKLQVLSTSNLSDSLIYVYLGSKHNKKEISRTVKIIQKLTPLVRGIRIVGSSSCASSWVASGKIDALINVKCTQGFGSTAGRLFISEAGGTVTNIKGQPQQVKDTLLCSNGILHDKILKIIW